MPIRSHHTARDTGSPDAPPRDALSHYRRLVGASGKAYLVSVFPVAHCPDFVEAVVIATGDDGVVWVGDSGAGGEAFQTSLAAAKAAGASIVHVHLLARDAKTRAAAIRDLDMRH